MKREEALKILKKNIENQNLVKHSLAAESAMKALANHFGENEQKWALCGLLHDIDYEKTQGDSKSHSIVGAKILEDLGMDKDICQTVKVHNEAHGILPETLMEKALFVVDPLTGLIVAAALVLPSKKLTDLTAENILNRFKERAFAKSVNREIIRKCEDFLNLSLEEFVEITLKAMQGIADQLGL